MATAEESSLDDPDQESRDLAFWLGRKVGNYGGQEVPSRSTFRKLTRTSTCVLL